MTTAFNLFFPTYGAWRLSLRLLRSLLFGSVCLAMAVAAPTAASAGVWEDMTNDLDRLGDKIKELGDDIGDAIEGDDEKDEDSQAYAPSGNEKVDYGRTEYNDNKAMVADAQSMLNQLGHNAGTVDGAYGNKTRRAIMSFERSQNLPAIGNVTTELLAHLGETLQAGGQSSRKPFDSANEDQKKLESYSKKERFALQGAIGGAAAGAIAGCVFTDNCAEGALYGALIGGGVGGAGGYIIGSRSESFDSEEERLDKQIAAAKREASAAREARLASEKVVVLHRERLDSLQKEAQESQSKHEEYSLALENAKTDAELMAAAMDRLNQELGALEEEIRRRQQESLGVPAELIEIRDQLRREHELLDQQLHVLTADLESRDVRTS